MAQVDFACSVLGFIKRLLRVVLPALARDKGILGSKEQFQRQIDAAFNALDPHEATEHDYRLAVANAACLEVEKLCGLLTDAVKSADGNLGRLLMRVGAILDGRPDTYDEMDAAAKRKATIDTNRIIAEVAKKLDSDKAELVKHIDWTNAMRPILTYYNM